MGEDFSLDEMMAELAVQRARVEQIQQTVERLEVTGRSRNNEVLAKIRGTGQFTQLVIDPRTFQQYNAQSISFLVLEAVNDAQRKVAEASRQTYEPLLEERRAATQQLADELGVR